MHRLAEALRVAEYPQIAFVGAGGKSSAMFHLARVFAGPVFLSSSTHLGNEQSNLADQHIILGGDKDFADLENAIFPGSVLITGDLSAQQKWLSPPENMLAKISKLARRKGFPFLIEADGSRALPLKAPAAHEPAIPDFVDQVVVVVGVSAIGKPLTGEFVHRPKIFSKIVKLNLGNPIEDQHLFALLADTKAGQKNIPKKVRRIALFNQMDQIANPSVLMNAAEILSDQFDGLLFTSLSSETQEVLGIREQTAGILLAAGDSSRYGENKALLDWKGEPFIRRIAKTMLASQLGPCVVVLGSAQQALRPAIEDLDVKIVINSQWESGQASSVKCGLNEIRPHVGGAMFFQVDRPNVSRRLINSLIDEKQRSFAKVVGPLIDDQRGTPILFDRSTFTDFEVLSGDAGGKQLFSKYRVQWMPWLDASQAIDVDTPEDYARLLNFAD